MKYFLFIERNVEGHREIMEKVRRKKNSIKAVLIGSPLALDLDLFLVHNLVDDHRDDDVVLIFVIVFVLFVVK